MRLRLWTVAPATALQHAFSVTWTARRSASSRTIRVVHGRSKLPRHRARRAAYSPGPTSFWPTSAGGPPPRQRQRVGHRWRVTGTPAGGVTGPVSKWSTGSGERALRTATNDAWRRGPIFRFHLDWAGTRYKGHAERFLVILRSEDPFPEDLRQRFCSFLRSLSLDPFTVRHTKTEDRKIVELDAGQGPATTS